MIKYENHRVIYEGKASELVVESSMIIYEIFRDLGPIERCCYIQTILSALVHAKEDEWGDKNETM